MRVTWLNIILETSFSKLDWLLCIVASGDFNYAKRLFNFDEGVRVRYECVVLCFFATSYRR